MCQDSQSDNSKPPKKQVPSAAKIAKAEIKAMYEKCRSGTALRPTQMAIHKDIATSMLSAGNTETTPLPNPIKFMQL